MQLLQIHLDTFSQASFMGFLTLTTYIITLLPTNLLTVFPDTKKTRIPQKLIKYRRLIGLLSFSLACIHGFIFFKQRNFDVCDPKTYVVYFQGGATFIIFTLLAITSNDWSVKRLKKNWKKLQQLTYLAIFLVTWHIWDKMAGHWTYLTPIAIIAMISIIVLFFCRLWIKHKSKQEKSQPETEKFRVLNKTLG